MLHTNPSALAPMFMSRTRSASLRAKRLVASLFVVAAACAAPLPLAWAADSQASRYYEDALVRFEKKDLDGAIIQLKNALQIDKTMLSVQMLLGRALLRNGDVVGAEVALNEALRLGVNRAEVVIPLGQAYLAQGKQKLFLEQEVFSPTALPPSVQGQLWLMRAAASTDVGEMRAALKAVEEARTMDPKSPDSWLAEVPIRIRGRQFDQANTAVERALALAPKSAQAWYQKGSVLHVSGDLARALSAYGQALSLEPDHVEARIARAGLQIDLGQVQEARADLEALRRVAPREPRVAYLQALLSERDNKPQEAKNALKDLVSLIDPVPMEFLRYRSQLLMLNGLAHYGLGEPEKAKQYLEAFQQVQGNTPAAKLLAQIYLKEGGVERAIDVLEGYLRANPDDGQAMTLLGSALMSKGHHARATTLMQQALRTRDAPEFRTVLGLSLIRGGQADSGTAELESAYRNDPRQTQAAVALIGLYLRDNKANKAVVIADALLKQQPANAGFYNLAGMARGQSGNLAGAKAAFERSTQLDANLMSPKLNLARLEIATHANDAAATRLAAILKTDEKNQEAMFEMAVLADRRGQSAEAQRWLEKANYLAGPREVRWGLALSDFHLRNGRPGPALEAVKQVSGKLPDDLSVLMTYARAQLANDDPSGAKSTLTSATRVAEYEPAQQVQIALLQLQANNAGGAAYSLEKALSAQADFLPAQALMTEVELRQGEPAKAEKRARGIVASQPKLAIGHSLLGDIALARSQTQTALEAYQRAHQLQPTSQTLLRLFGLLANQNGGKPAVQLAQDWLKGHPKDATVQRALADAYARSGDFVTARKAYENLLVIAPDDAQALNNLANVLLRLKDPGALKMAERAVNQSPNNPNAIDTLGWALFQSGQTDRGLQLLRDARLREPGNPEIRYHLAVVLAQTGRMTEARSELESALGLGSDFSSQKDAQRLLASMR